MTWKDISIITSIIVFTAGGILGAENRYAPASVVQTVARVDLENQLRALQFQLRLEKCAQHDSSFCQWLRQEIERIKRMMTGG